MKYADKVQSLMAAYPGRTFRMVEIVRFACPRPTCKQERNRVREGVRIVLDELVRVGVVVKRDAINHGSFATFIWKVPD